MRHRRAAAAEPENAGEDSFMDVVANLVGILIILIMVVGARARDAAVEGVTNAPSGSLQEAEQAHDAARRQLDNLEGSIREVQSQAETQEALANQRRQERHQLNVLLTAARLELDDRRQSLTKTGQENVQVAVEQRALQDSMAKIQAQRQALLRQTQRVEKIDHLPTPLAKTVFGHEEHFRLEHGRLTYVPLNELAEQLRAEAPRRAPRLMEVPEFTETIGPIQGFHLRYTMQRHDVASINHGAAVVRQLAELKEFVLVPTSDITSESLDDALVDGSQFRQALDAMKPGATVITVWTYPDSFREFRRLKQWLFDRGYASAARPLPEGQLITGSPQGSRSAAQ